MDTTPAGREGSARTGLSLIWWCAAAVPMAVLATPLVLILAAVQIAAGPRHSRRLFNAVERRLFKDAIPDQRPDPAESRFYRLNEAARYLALAVFVSAVLQWRLGWPTFDYVSVAGGGAVLAVAVVASVCWLLDRRRSPVRP